MRVVNRRWGEITIKQQGKGKNKFDKTKSFSIENSQYEYKIDELKDIFSIVTDLTEKFKYLELKNILEKMGKNESN
jgi:hypothetical protein